MYVDWIHPAQGRNQWRTIVSTVMNRCVAYGGGFCTNRVTVSFSRRALLYEVTYCVCMYVIHVWCVSSVHINYPGPLQCSLVWVFKEKNYNSLQVVRFVNNCIQGARN
jgi:hypothetical protein